jgi:transposase InsO family protein
VLYQTIDGVDRVIAYASRGLSNAEQRYPVHKLEFLALKWSVTKKFHDYLYGNSFVVYTDNNPMTYVLEKAKLDAAGHRWIAALGAYDFQIKYRPGKANSDADGLSRMPQISDPDEYCEVSLDSVKALCQSHSCAQYVTSLSISASLPTGLDLYEEVVPRDWRQLQSQDPVVNQFVRAVTRSKKPNVSEVSSRRGNILLREFGKLVIKRGVLYRRICDKNEIIFQLVLPEKFQKLALKGAHDDMGHLGRDKTLGVLRERVYWPNISNHVDDYLKSCERCIRRKSPTDIRVPMVSIRSSQPMELVCMDYLTLEMSKGGYEHLLVITDHFTKYAVAVPTRNQTAKVTADALFSHFIMHYGFPKRLHSDQGANFESNVIRELCTLSGMIKSRTTPYNPSGNGITERLNRTLLNMLGTLEPKDKQDWKSQIGSLLHAYNCCKHDSTGFSPYRLMFGRQPRLALDVVLGLISDQPVQQEYGKYVDHLRNSLKHAYELATRNSGVAQQRQKSHHDIRARAAILEVGDRVLVKILAVKGKNKIADRWENDPYLVQEQPNSEIPVYIVKKEDGSGTCKTLHRKHLLPIGSLPVRNELDEIPRVRPTPVKRKIVPKRVRSNPDPVVSHNDVEQVSHDHDIHEDDDEDDDTGVIIETEVEFINVLENEPQVVNPTPAAVAESDDEAVESDVPDAIPLPTPVPAPRRSTRQKRKPQWLNSGEYELLHVMAQTHNSLNQMIIDKLTQA